MNKRILLAGIASGLIAAAGAPSVIATGMHHSPPPCHHDGSSTDGGAVCGGQLDFEVNKWGGDVPHGAVVSTSGNPSGIPTYSGFELPPSLTSISVTNLGGGPGIAVAYDTNIGEPNDPDLNYPWTAGNLVGTQLGNVAIIQENSINCGDGICNEPDDEGDQPTGYIYLNFDQDFNALAFDLVDAEASEAANTYVRFYLDGNTQKTIYFDDFADASSSIYSQDGVVFAGDNSANRIELSSDLLGVEYDKLKFYFSGSMGIDNIIWNKDCPPDTPGVPEPTTLWLIALALVALGMRRGGAIPAFGEIRAA